MRTIKLFSLILIILITTGCTKKEPAPSQEQPQEQIAQQEEWTPLFAADLSNAVTEPNGWKFEEGVLSPTGHGDIWTKEQYGDFQLELEFKLDEGTNSGVFLRCGDIVNWLHTCIEVQVFDSNGVENPTREDCGAIFDVLAPSKNMVKEPGQWNKYIITCKGQSITVNLNGEQIIDMDLNLWTEAHKNPDGTPNKFDTAYKDMPKIGQIGLQYHGHPVWYRNLNIKKL